MVVSTAVTVAVLVVVFVGIFPKVADYSEAWSSIQQMPTAYVVALVVATVANLAVYVWPLQAALPGLGYGPGFVVRQTSFACWRRSPAGCASTWWKVVVPIDGWLPWTRATPRCGTKAARRTARSSGSFLNHRANGSLTAA